MLYALQKFILDELLNDDYFTYIKMYARIKLTPKTGSK